MNEAGSTEPAGPNGADSGLVPGGSFSGLVIDSEIGRGGMGVIYRVRDPELDRVRALKVLAADRSADPDFRERFRRESRQAAAIEHPNVIPVYRAGEEGGRLFLVMRYVDGPSLAEVLAERGGLPLDEVVELVHQVASGLDAAHVSGLVHRDVKPGNVLLEGEGHERRAFLCDFGISKLAEAGTHLTATGEFVGTVDYVAPEQLEGDAVERRADVYSLACVAFHMLTGEPPFRRDTQLATMFAHANAPRPEPGPRIPSAVRQVLTRGMAVRADDRPASAGEFAAELARAVGAAGVATTDRLAKPRRSRSRLIAVIAIGAGLAVAAAVVALPLGEGDEQPAAPAVETGTFEVESRPLSIAVGPGRVWVASPASGSVTPINPEDRDLTPAAIAIGRQPAAVAVGFDSLWIADRESDELLRFDATSGAVQAKVPVGRAPADIAIGAADVWVANAGSENVSRVSPESGDESVTDVVPVGDGPADLAVAADGVWVANRDSRNVMFIDARKGHVSGRPIDAAQRPSDVAVGAGYVWIADNLGGTVIRVDEERKEVVGNPIAVGSLPRGVIFGLGFVWVANGEDGTVSRIDPGAGDVVGDPIPVGARPASIASGLGSIWTADFGDSTVTELHPDP